MLWRGKYRVEENEEDQGIDGECVREDLKENGLDKAAAHHRVEHRSLVTLTSPRESSDPISPPQPYIMDEDMNDHEGKMSKKCTYNKSFLSSSFSFIVNSAMQMPQCVTCKKTLASESMKPFKLKEHLTKVHPELANKDLAYFKIKEHQIKRIWWRRSSSSAAH
ncbi:uncharacterized protein [Macrobrachium rosenbergii]|uniref:uncharacterized protein n=1 Tax=Macrobrachium rosenbergii TaxID=79674 RepID=UPI0034D719AB